MEFCTNHASPPDLASNLSKDSSPPVTNIIPIRHPTVFFSDGTICLLDVNRKYYFNVHKGLLCRHSGPLRQVINNSPDRCCFNPDSNRDGVRLIEGNLTLETDDDPEDLARFLSALYDGVSDLKFDATDFPIVSSLLRLSTKYQVEHIRKDILRGLSIAWPKTLTGWEFREADATDSQGNYRPRAIYPHPILIINLARQTNALEILPAAFYDLSRGAASEMASGFILSSSTGPPEHHTLSDADLLCALKGREHASRFLTTFIANELEGRSSSANCMYTNSPDGSDDDACRKRICRATFEATTFEVLRDVNGIVFHRSSDPLFAIMDADLMQSSQRGPGVSSPAQALGSPGGTNTGQPSSSNGRLGLLQRACEACRMEFSNVVDATREEMWHRLPVWFGIELADWP